VPPGPSVWIVRHGETEWSRNGRHTSVSELDLTELGQSQAVTVAPVAAAIGATIVLCSPRLRARRTAELAGLVPYEVDEDLSEWDYGELEGLTTDEIRRTWPGWTIWDGPWAGGETASDVTSRADRVVERVKRMGDCEVVLVGHGHFSRVVAARWVGAPAASGGWLELGTATVSQLGWAREAPVVRRWNVPVGRSPVDAEG
jgi:broad specificity phosphatase PhoE